MPENEPHRDFKLADELLTIVLRFVQLRESRQQNITSVKCDDYELRTLPEITTLDLRALSNNDKRRLCKRIGYTPAPRGSKCDIVVNGKRIAIRSMNYTDRALVNHLTRPKYEKVCNRIGLSIADLDLAVEKYIERRKLGLFNEDCFYQSTLNPFIVHKQYLKKLLSFMAFNSFDFKKEYNEDGFITDNVDRIMDFSDPIETSLWFQYTPENYFDSIWTSLCFSLRDSKGMPTDEDLFKPGNESILKWNYPFFDGYRTRNKAALHIRIKKYDSVKFGSPFELAFKQEIVAIKQNRGERDEYLLKLFLIECRQKSIPVPIGDRVEVVRSVGARTYEYGTLSFKMQWDQLEAEELISVCMSVKATKAKMFDKADVYINGVGISVKTERGGNPSIINHTTRDKILRVMNSINQPIAPLDSLVDRYWTLRLANRIGEDTIVSDFSCPFSHPDEEKCLSIIKPLINYFAFDGTGTRDSESPAQLILSMYSPTDTSTWTYYDKDTFITSVWERLVFSIRQKATPLELDDTRKDHQEMKPWIREINTWLYGALHVRVGSKRR